MSDADRAVVIRRAEPRDLDAIGRLGASLVRVHHEFDALRFIAPGDTPEQTYLRFLEAQMHHPSTLVLVAERVAPGHAPRIAGYVYAAVEPASFKELRDRAGFIHDLLVAGDARGSGVGQQLIEAAVAWLGEQGVPRVLLWAAVANPRARKLFEAHGFRPTMIEMTREL